MKKMKNHITIPYREVNHGSFDEEWLPHNKVSGWWYVTGYLTEEGNSNLYSYQYTLLKVRKYGFTFYVSMIGFTDFQTKEHYYHQRFGFQGRKIYVNKNEAAFLPYSSLTKKEDAFDIILETDKITLNLTLNKGKGAFWHADNGVLVMGNKKDKKQRTVYYSYPNMPTKGIATIKTNEKKLNLTGSSWLDRQWGSYDLVDASTHWEWFSLRFFDQEEIMLFAFPQHPYLDGTYITQNRVSVRVRDYELSPVELVEVDGLEFSKGWKLKIPGIKEEEYTIQPLLDGQLNLAYYELLASIFNTKNELVGYCFVELLPGVRNPDKKIKALNLFKRK